MTKQEFIAALLPLQPCVDGRYIVEQMQCAGTRCIWDDYPSGVDIAWLLEAAKAPYELQQRAALAVFALVFERGLEGPNYAEARAVYEAAQAYLIPVDARHGDAHRLLERAYQSLDFSARGDKHSIASAASALHSHSATGEHLWLVCHRVSRVLCDQPYTVEQYLTWAQIYAKIADAIRSVVSYEEALTAFEARPQSSKSEEGDDE